MVPVLKSLIQHPDSLGHQQVARRVLRGLSSDNDVLKEIVGPVIGALEHSDPAVIATKAAAALNDLEKTTGVHYRMDFAASPETRV